MALLLGTVAALSGCAPAQTPQQLQQQLNAAIVATNLDEVSALLEKGASPDKAVGTAPSAVRVAGELLRRSKGTDRMLPAAKAFGLLQKFIRHRDREVVDATGKMAFAFVNAERPDISTPQLVLLLPDGTRYVAILSAVETNFQNTIFNNLDVVVRFGLPHRLQGTVLNGVLEVDDMAALSPSSAYGIKVDAPDLPVAISMFLPSTVTAMQAYRN